jgi:hypothetical protein
MTRANANERRLYRIKNQHCQMAVFSARFGKFCRISKSSGGLPISGGFLADLTNFPWVCFCLADLVDSGGFGVSISKK